MKLLFFFALFRCISFGKLSYIVFDMTCVIEDIINWNLSGFLQHALRKSPTADRALCIKPKHSGVRTRDIKYLRHIPFESSLFSEFKLNFSLQYPGTILKIPGVCHVLYAPCRGPESQILRKPAAFLHHCVDLFQTRSIWIVHVYSLEYSRVLLTCGLCLNTLRLRSVMIACSKLGHSNLMTHVWLQLRWTLEACLLLLTPRVFWSF